MDFFEQEAQSRGFCLIAGVDEAGRGPLAGPVVAAAVIFPNPLAQTGILNLGIKDSKKLAPKKREELASSIYARAMAVGVGIVWPEEIDSINILNATLMAMKKALSSLLSPSMDALMPDYVLIDGNVGIDSLPGRHDAIPLVPQKTVIGGDDKSVTIAAASIIAKTTRDKIMDAYHRLYPCYNFLKNKGYGTREHFLAIERFGLTPIHRKSFCRFAK